jgi:hypothetical protein
MEPTATHTAELDQVRLRRAELREALGDLEQALAAPAAGRAEDWGKAVSVALDQIGADWKTHVQVTEGPGGLHHAIRTASFRLIKAVEALTEEHAAITVEIDELVAQAEQPCDADAVETIRDSATRLLGHIIKHRQRGADLIYEAYQTDIGGDG